MTGSNNEAQIWYLFQSGFAVKTRNHFLVFDYYLDSPKGPRAGLDMGMVDPKTLSGLDVVVFSSHGHKDHFNPVVLEWGKYAENIHYVLSYDIGAAADTGNILPVHPDHEYDLKTLHITTLDSTDIGVAFLVEVDGLTIYHAGDLNWWHWEGEPEDENRAMAEKYTQQIDLLKGKHIDLAFVPLDPRLESHYLLGLDYFMKTAGAEMVFPMHFWKRHSVFKRLKKDPRAAGYAGKVAEITRRGQRFVYSIR